LEFHIHEWYDSCDDVKKILLLRNKNNLSSVGTDRPPNH
jgi:hypothetical protein